MASAFTAALLALTALVPAAQAAPVAEGPDKGTLIIAGGGKLGPEIVGRFIALAGGPGAHIVVIPTAGEVGPMAPTATACRCSRRWAPPT